jgi:hypothetical protein
VNEKSHITKQILYSEEKKTGTETGIMKEVARQFLAPSLTPWQGEGN